MQRRKCSRESERQLPDFERTTLGLRSWLGRTYSPPKSTERRRHSLSLISARGLQRFATDRHDWYDIIEALLGKQVVDELRQNPFPAQQVRSTHLHSGEFHGPELIMANFMRTYEDPSFRDAHRTMAKVTHSAIVEMAQTARHIHHAISQTEPDTAAVGSGITSSVGSPTLEVALLHSRSVKEIERTITLTGVNVTQHLSDVHFL